MIYFNLNDLILPGRIDARFILLPMSWASSARVYPPSYELGVVTRRYVGGGGGGGGGGGEGGGGCLIDEEREQGERQERDKERDKESDRETEDKERILVSSFSHINSDFPS